jgi:hypothetical protein
MSKRLARECARNLRQEDGHDWQCTVKYQKRIVGVGSGGRGGGGKKIVNKKKNSQLKNTDNNDIYHVPLFCICSYDYDCNIENERFYLSLNYLNKLLKENRSKNINRGADYQCEIALKKQTNKEWSCVLKEAEQLQQSHEKEAKLTNLINNDEFYCDCYFKNRCKHERIVDFY